MKEVKVTAIDQEIITFEGDIKLYSDHNQDCCESHYLSFTDLKLEDFEGLKFDLSTDDFFRRIEGYGIELIPINGHSVKIPGYGYNNGYYSSELTLFLRGKDFSRTYDITECQVIND